MKLNFLQKRRFLWCIIIFGLCILPKFLSSINEVIDPFTYSPIAISQASLYEGRILIHPFGDMGSALQDHANSLSERAAVTSFLVIFSRITGLSVGDMRFLPINGLILIVLSYTLAKILLKSTLAASIYALFLSYEPCINRLGYNIFYIAFGFSLFLTFLILFTKNLESPESSEERRGKKSIIMLLLTTFVATYLTYYTVEFDTIVLCVAVCLILVATKFRKFRLVLRGNLHSLSNLTLIFIIIFVGFDSIFYSFCKKISARGVLDFLIKYIHFVYNLLFAETRTIATYQSTIFTVYIGLLLLLSIVIPVIGYTLYLLALFLRNLHTRKITRIDFRHIIYFALLLPWVADLVVYGSLGFFAYKYILLIFSLLAFFSIGRFRTNKFHMKAIKKIRILLLCSLLILSLMKFGFWFKDEKLGYADRYYSLITPTISWMTQFASNQSDVLTDLKTGGPLLMKVTEAQKATSICIQIFSTETVSFLYVNDSKTADELFHQYGYNYLILPYKSISQPMELMSWRYSEPLGEAFWFLQHYATFLRLYDDGQGIVYKYCGSKTA